MDQEQSNPQTERPRDDVMLSSAEDLNTDGSFMERELEAEENVDELEAETAEVENFDEDAPDEGDNKETLGEEARRVEEAERTSERSNAAPVRRIEVSLPPKVAKPVEKSHCEPRTKFERPHFGHEPEEKSKARILTAEPSQQSRINKMALIWMIVLTVILTGVMGIMLYAFIVDHRDEGGKTNANPVSDTVLISGALEVYLNEVNLDNYNGNIVLVNSGGLVTLTGKLSHTVYVNSSSAVTLLLKNVTVEAEGGPAIVNVTKNDMVIRATGSNRLYGKGSGQYPAAVYSVGPMAIGGDGILNIAAGAEGIGAIKTEKGYRVTGASLYALGRADVEAPLTDAASADQTQAYFAKNLSQTYASGLLLTASTTDGSTVAEFRSTQPFSSILVSNAAIRDGVKYTIEFGEAGARE